MLFLVKAVGNIYTHICANTHTHTHHVSMHWLTTHIRYVGCIPLLQHSGQQKYCCFIYLSWITGVTLCLYEVPSARRGVTGSSSSAAHKLPLECGRVQSGRHILSLLLYATAVRSASTVTLLWWRSHLTISVHSSIDIIFLWFLIHFSYSDYLCSPVYVITCYCNAAFYNKFCLCVTV